MGSEGPRPGPAAQDEPVCAACGGPVGTAIRRRKVLGVFVPVWGPGPCRNAQCEACVDEADAETARPGGGSSGRASARRSRSRHGRYGRRPAAPGDNEDK
ncbi:hypothetical protein AB0H82_24925 [Streptomyces sp. NPDC050732]|uniref:hypothetical protein n=1 Tax=Streptomyces sp. NPDC050732 TaxID=3154632 RepID=UPI0034298DC8